MPRSDGLGNPHEEDFFFRGYRDSGQGDPYETRPIAFDPTFDPKRLGPDEYARMKAWFEYFRQFLKEAVFYSKRPAFIEPPFFSKPTIKAKSITILSGATGQLFTRQIQDRERAIVSAIGVEVSPLSAVMNQQVLSWFSTPDVSGQDFTQNIIPLWDDQTTGQPFRVQSGQTTIVPGSVEKPFSLLQNGVGFEVKGNRLLAFSVQNNSPGTITVRGVLSLYQYWVKKSTEFDGSGAELQL